ncbi:MAG: transglutaminase domain-containing protein [Ruminococcaceae bacterium]|nr:transglutaminase domain-containing protein [Oscillospiraceae bacterium]
MKAERKKIGKKKNDNFAIYNFPYFKKDQSFLQFFAGKALLAFITCFCGTYYFAEMLKAEEEAFVCAFFAGVSCVVFLVLLGLFGRRNVILFVLAAVFISLKGLIECGESFFYHILRVADGNIIDAESLIKNKTETGEPMPMLLILSLVFGFVFAVSSHHRFNPEAILTYSAIMVIPSFLSQHTSYTSRLGVFIAGLAALWAASLASSANASLAVGGMANISVLDRQYRKNNKSRSPIKRIKADSLHYNRHLSDSAVIFIITLLIVSLTSSLFPQNGNLKFDTIVQRISDCVRSIGEWSVDFFDSVNVSPYKGFFSADGGSINISNGINPNDTPQSNTPVLEIVTQNKDKLYLRGDVGYEFDGKRWKSIADINFNGIQYSLNLRDEYMNLNNEQVKIKDVFESYTPEVEYYLARKSMGEDPDFTPYIELQKVKINYLQKLNTVFFAGTPANYMFRNNELFSVKGDFIALADKGKINSMETTVLYQNGSFARMLEDYYYMLDYRESYFASLPVTFEDYSVYSKAYRNYVYDYYTAVPDDERRTIVNLLWQSAFNTDEFDSISYNAHNDMISRAKLAEYLEEYFISGIYSYSLNSDNFHGSESPLYTFLFETKSGHCAMYASSMCLLLRYMGVPARYVTGFTVGGDNCTETSDGYKYTVLQKNLHAWVEVYFDGIGWIPYDPTPTADRLSSSAAETTTDAVTETTTVTTAHTTTTAALTTTTAKETESESETSTAPLTDNSGNSIGSGGGISPEAVKIILISVGTVLLLFVIAMSIAGGLRSLTKKQNRLMKFFKSGDSETAVKEMLEFSLKLLKIRGIYRQKGETPEEFGFRADKTLKSGNIFRDAIPFYEKAQFDREPEFTKDEQLLVYESVSKLLKNTLDDMKPLKRFITRVRLFGRAKKKLTIDD